MRTVHLAGALTLALAIPVACSSAADGRLSVGSGVATVDSVEVPEIREVREVRTTWTHEFGVDHPTGLTYVPGRGELLVGHRAPSGTAVVRFDLDEEARGSFRLPVISDPSTLAYDPTAREVTAVSDAILIASSESEIHATRPAVRRTSLGPVGLRDPKGATFDPVVGTLRVLDAAAGALVSVSRSATSPASAVALPPQIAKAGPRGLALNPDDGLLYVGSAEDRRLDALDTAGHIRKTYSLASLDLHSLSAITFAPSSDTTDTPATQHLYIADAGDSETRGGIIEVTLASAPELQVAAEAPALVQTIATSQFTPASPDPSGITYLLGADRFELCDSEVEEVTGAGFHGVNLWELTRAGTVTDTGTTAPSVSNEPTGLGFDPGTNTLFISDDNQNRVHVVKPGADARFGTGDDVRTFVDTGAYDSLDTEDPAFDTASGHLFWVDGVSTEIFRLNPVNGIFGDGNDVVTHFDVGQFGPTDTEGLAYDPARDTLVVGDRVSKQIYEVTKSGAFVRTVDASETPGMRFLSGLAVAPASNDPARLNYWVVDRGIDNGADPNENDGKLFELSSGVVTQPPVVLPGSASVVEGNSGTKMIDVPVTLSRASAVPVTVEYQTLDHTAQEPADYVATSGTVTFAPGDTSEAVAVTVKGDAMHEPDEVMVVSFRNPTNAVIGGFFGLGPVTITNDDPLPIVTPGSAGALEGDSGTSTVLVPVTLSRPSSSTVTVGYQTLNHTAAAPADYVAGTGTVTFAPGQTAKSVAVVIRGDTAPEGDEVLLVSFRNATGASIGGFYGLGFAFITNDD